MGIVDIIILIILLIFSIRGFIKGFIIETIGVLGLILAFLCSFMIYGLMLKLAMYIGLTGNIASVTAYLVGFLMIYIVIAILGTILHKILILIYLGWLNRLGGFVFGCLKGIVIVGIILWGVFYVIPRDTTISRDINKSQVAAYCMQSVTYLYEKINNISGVKRVNPFN